LHTPYSQIHELLFIIAFGVVNHRLVETLPIVCNGIDFIRHILSGRSCYATCVILLLKLHVHANASGLRTQFGSSSTRHRRRQNEWSWTCQCVCPCQPNCSVTTTTLNRENTKETVKQDARLYQALGHPRYVGQWRRQSLADIPGEQISDVAKMLRLQYSTKAFPSLSSCWPDSLQHGKDLPDRYLNTGIVLDRITQVTNCVAALTARNNMRDYHVLTANCQTFVLEVMKGIIEHSGPNGTPVTPPGNTFTTGLMSSKRPIALGSFSFLLVALGMFPLALRMFWLRYSGAIAIENDLMSELVTVLCVCAAKMLRTDTQFIQRRSTFACFVFENRTLMEHVDLYGPARAGLTTLEFTSGLFMSGTTHLVLKDTVRTARMALLLQTGFVFQMLYWAEFPLRVKPTIQPSSISAELRSRSVSSSGRIYVDAGHAAKHDQHQEHRNLQCRSEQTGKHATGKLVQRRRLTDGERQETSLLVRRMPRKRHRVIVLDFERESLAIEK
jgi:hypothetical protein